MALSYNLGYQESISVHPTRRQIFAGKSDSTFWNIWEWVILLYIVDHNAIWVLCGVIKVVLGCSCYLEHVSFQKRANFGWKERVAAFGKRNIMGRVNKIHFPTKGHLHGAGSRRMDRCNIRQRLEKRSWRQQALRLESLESQWCGFLFNFSQFLACLPASQLKRNFGWGRKRSPTWDLKISPRGNWSFKSFALNRFWKKLLFISQ